MAKALIIVDAQNDFVEGGSLAVDGGKHAMRKLAGYLTENHEDYDLVVTTQDWHIDPKGHFAESPDFINTWPVHCVAETQGSEIVAPLAQTIGELILNKGIVLERVFKGEYEAAYSGFEGRTGNQSMLPNASLAELLDFYDVTEVDVTGLATDYCVKATAMDAVKEGFETTVLSEYCAGIHEDGVEALLTNGFADAGVKVTTAGPIPDFAPESFLSRHAWHLEDGTELWLLTPRELDMIPDGMVITYIDGTHATKGVDNIDTSVRFGYLACGITTEQFISTNEGN